MDELYKNIRDLRIARGLSQKELARLTGYTDRSSIAKIESGEVDLTTSKIELFAKVFGIRNPGDLLGELEIDPKDIVFAVPTPDEREVLLAYRRASADRKDAIRLLLGI